MKMLKHLTWGFASYPSCRRCLPPGIEDSSARVSSPDQAIFVVAGYAECQDAAVIRQAAQSLETGSSPLRSWPGNIEDLIHHLCARGDDRAKLAPVYRFRDAR
jgi:hypothetical protein